MVCFGVNQFYEVTTVNDTGPDLKKNYVPPDSRVILTEIIFLT